MEYTTEQVTGEEPGVTEHRMRSDELVRPVNGRVVAGVARGFANRFGVPVWVPRAVLIVTAFAGGVGIALYAAGWALIRSEDERQTPAERFFSDATSLGNWIGVALMVLAGLILIGRFSFFSGEVLLAVGLLTVGVLMYTGHIPGPSSSPPRDEEQGEPVDRSGGAVEATNEPVEAAGAPAGVAPAGGPSPPPSPPKEFLEPTPPDLSLAPPRERSILGRVTVGMMLLAMGVLAIIDNIPSVPVAADPRHYLALAVTVLGMGLLVGSILGRARWLIILGVIMVPTLMFSPAFEYDWSADTFDRAVIPESFNELESVYAIDVGNMVIDLTELPWSGQTVELAAEVGIGNLEVRVPHDVALFGGADADVGRVAGPEFESFGLGDPRIEFQTEGESGELLLDLSVNVGNIDVVQR